MDKIRVLVVDDSVLMRTAISHVLNSDPEIEVVGVAANGRLALSKMPQLMPELVTLDIEMPDLNGLETLAILTERHPQVPVIMLSSLTLRGAEATLTALAQGAVDYVAKPGGGDPAKSLEILTAELVPKIKAHARRRNAPPSTSILPGKPHKPAAQRPAPGKVRALCIATSTGGPNALAEVFATLPAVQVPIFIVQHMPPMFTRLLAERLDAVSAVHVVEAEDGMKTHTNCAYVAPGGLHMEVRREGAEEIIRLNENMPENSCRPAADVLFRSAAAVYKSGTMGIVLTGMGYDGLRGCEAIRAQGGWIVAQDEPSSTVWGMPRAVVEAQLADRIVPLAEVQEEIVLAVRRNIAERSARVL